MKWFTWDNTLWELSNLDPARKQKTVLWPINSKSTAKSPIYPCGGASVSSPYYTFATDIMEIEALRKLYKLNKWDKQFSWLKLLQPTWAPKPHPCMIISFLTEQWPWFLSTWLFSDLQKRADELSQESYGLILIKMETLQKRIQCGSRVSFHLTTVLNSEASKNICIPEMAQNALIRRLNVYSLAKNKKPLPL